MAEHQVEEVLKSYKAAILWVESLIPDIKPTCRIYEYLKLLELTVHENRAGVTTSKPTRLILEAHQKSNLLIEIYRRFEKRREPQFINKLRESLFGPVYSHEEELGKGPSRSSFGRDIESEFLMATRIRNPEIVSFEGNDIVYDLKDFKFGVEVKRIHSLENINDQFIKGCQQIDTNASIQCGMVALRFDNHFYYRNEGGLVELIERGEHILSFKSAQACSNAATFQTGVFLEQRGTEFLERARPFQKVKGVCVFCFLPGMLMDTNVPFMAGHARYGFFESPDNSSRSIFERMRQEFEPAS
jgi:hypothetical protein